MNQKNPYPPVKAQAPNPRYAREMLDNIGGDNSEMSAVSLYFYNHLVTAGQEEISNAFYHISVTEMHHLNIFGTLALQLGENPRLWTCKDARKVYWSPAYNCYPLQLDELLENAAAGEEAAIRKYTGQAAFIADANILQNLRRIIEDERRHLAVFIQLRKKYCP